MALRQRISYSCRAKFITKESFYFRISRFIWPVENKKIENVKNAFLKEKT